MPCLGTCTKRASHDFADIQRFATPLKHAIYGIEPGNDGNRLVLTLIKEKQFGLGEFKLIESSEQGMLAQVERAYAARQPIVFLGWEPHPMNTRFEMRYLTGGDASFGPNFGGATIYTNTRAGYSRECPNVGRLLKNLKFTLRGESEIMASILERSLRPKPRPKRGSRTIQVRSRPGSKVCVPSTGSRLWKPTAAATTAQSARGFEPWVTGHKIPLGKAIATAIEFVKTTRQSIFCRRVVRDRRRRGCSECAAVHDAFTPADPAHSRTRLAAAPLDRTCGLRGRSPCSSS